MVCDICAEKQANVFFTQIVGDQVKKVNLCEDCSKHKGVTDATSYALAEMLLGMGESETKTTSSPSNPARTPGEPTCESCGFGHSDFKKAGRLGCPHCYDLFRGEIEALLKNIHKGVRHVGKVPARAAAQGVVQHLNDLKVQLSRAIENEQFEEAARLRDEINKLSANR
jgi:protein arginine kinase activator